MPQLLIRRIDETVKENLRLRAKQNGVSMEEEARAILRAELAPDKQEYGLGSRIADLFRGIPGNDEPLPELPDFPVRPARFDE